MVPHLEGAGVTVLETAILISIRLCLCSPSAHKSLLQSEINSYWSALISQVRHEGNAVTGTSHLSQCWKHHFVCETSTLHASPPTLPILTGRNDGVWSSRSPVSRSHHTQRYKVRLYTHRHTYTHATCYTLHVTRPNPDVKSYNLSATLPHVDADI